MSGITPLLDTLLHQVLGKRVDIPAPRELNEPVRPMDPGRAPRAVHSDSRLNAQQPGLSNVAGAPVEERSGLAGQGLRGDTPPASTHTHFSQAARTIADILVKFPAPPSTLRPAVPLMAPSLSAEATPSQLAAQLQTSINTSGLFYESQLARWYRGELPRQALELQPQMQQTQTQRQAILLPTPLLMLSTSSSFTQVQGAPEAGGPLASHRLTAPTNLLQWPVAAFSPRGVPTISGPLLPLETLPVQGFTPQAVGQPAQAVDIAQASLTHVASQRGELLTEALQGVVRQQLEMLVTPTLRWEGDVWSGIFMALVIQLPDERGHRASSEQETEKQDEQDQAWHSTLALTLPVLGEIHVDLRLKGERVALTLESTSREVVERLEGGQERLRKRLEARGFQEVALLARLRIDEGEVLR